MAKDNDGGPAFPPTEETVNAFPGREFQTREWWSGMSLRDYFAANYEPRGTNVSLAEKEASEERARLRYLEADAMLKARSK